MAVITIIDELKNPDILAAVEFVRPMFEELPVEKLTITIKPYVKDKFFNGEGREYMISLETKHPSEADAEGMGFLLPSLIEYIDKMLTKKNAAATPRRDAEVDENATRLPADKLIPRLN